MRDIFVYILASKSRRLYVGVSSKLVKRIYEHKTAKSEHTARYRIDRLVYFEQYSRPIDAIEREKRIKAFVRSRKIALIQLANPTWEDLSADWFDWQSLNDVTAGKADPPAAARPSG